MVSNNDTQALHDNNEINREDLAEELENGIKESKFNLPKNHKVELLIWKYLTISDLKKINEESLPEKIKYELSRALDLSDYEGDKKDAILLDFFFYTIQFARDHDFSMEKTSTLISIANRIHEVCVETPFDNILNCYQYFRELLVTHSVMRPPFSIDIFNIKDIQNISEFMINTYFRHYKLYKYAFTPLVRLDLKISYTGDPTPSIPASEIANDISPASTDRKPVTPIATPVIQDTPGEQELRELIKKHLGLEIAELKKGIEDELIKVNDTVSKKLAVVEPQVSQSAAKKRGKK